MEQVYFNKYLPLTDTPTIGNYNMPKLKVSSRYALVDCSLYPEMQNLTFNVNLCNNENKLSFIELMLL